MARTATTPYQSRTRNVAWLDVNSHYTQNGKPLLLPDIRAINNSLRNLLTCPIGARGPAFQPRYGTNLIRMLQEPLHPSTANRIRATLIQSIERWEPRLVLNYGLTFVQPNSSLPGYNVQVAYYYKLTPDTLHTAAFEVGV